MQVIFLMITTVKMSYIELKIYINIYISLNSRCNLLRMKFFSNFSKVLKSLLIYGDNNFKINRTKINETKCNPRCKCIHAYIYIYIFGIAERIYE